MNKTININLGGFPFTVDDEAFQVLKEYIDKVEKYFQKSDGAEEITTDIEYRLAELIRSKMGARKIVMISDVRSSIQILGTPEMFGDGSFEEESDQREEKKTGNFEDFEPKEKEKYTTGKKLYRNPDNQIVAGVCSGLAAYFGINDPVWIRLIFALTVISGGMGVIAYLVIWAIVPEAKNSADRLAMKGKNINITNIAKEVESQFNNISKKFSSLGKTNTPGSKSGFEKFEHHMNTDFAGGIEEMGHKFGDFVRNLVLGTLSALKSMGKGLVIILLIILGIIWFGALFSAFYAKSALMMILPFGALGSLSYVIISLLLIFIPLILIGLWIAGAFKYSHNRRRIVGYTSILWFVALMIVAFSTINWVKTFKVEGSVMEGNTYEIDKDTIGLQSSNFYYGGGRVSFGNVAFIEDYIVSNKIRINLSVAKDDKVHVSKTVRARGESKEDAKNVAGIPEYNYKIVDNIIEFDNEFKIPAEGTMRNQKVVIDIEVPEGKFIRVNSNIGMYIDNIQFAVGHQQNERIYDTQILKATDKGFIIK